MPDLLVKLYELPEVGCGAGPEKAFRVRRAMAYEKARVVDWVRGRFGEGWASECDVAFASRPISCLIATQDAEIVGFACYDATCKGFFGPVGVAETSRGLGIGTALLIGTLRDMAAAGYGYAVIGGAGSADFYARAAGAVEIPGSNPGIYRDRLR